MPMLKKLAGKMWNRVTDTFDSIGDSFTGFLTKKYPDINEVFDTLTEMKKQYAITDESEEVEGGDGGLEHDDKWRPMFVTLGLLYKLQRIQDSSPSSWYNRDDIFVHDDVEEEKLLKTFGFYWHYCMKVAESLRSINNKGTGHNMDDDGNLVANEDTFNNVMVSTGLKREDILFAHATDSLHVDEHCPDFSIVLLHELRQVLIVICGTRMIPAPKMRDVFMDLYAESMPFLRGEGHMGMVIGARNIIKYTINKIARTLAEVHQGYNIMVIGYSLGAGICQLVAMDMLEGESKSQLPAETVVRCISYGSPPVFKPGESGYKCPNIFSVVYNNDGLSSASVASVTKLFMQIRAVDHLQMRRRDMLKLLWNKIPTLDGGELCEDGNDDDDDFEGKCGPTTGTAVLKEHSQWMAIKEAVDGVECGGLAPLEHPARQLYIFKRKENNVITRKLRETLLLSAQLRLRGAMFSHHMPWGYNALFEGYGNGMGEVDLDVLDVSSMGAEEEAAPRQSGNNSLYPDLSDL